jgi:hypothetical protein
VRKTRIWQSNKIAGERFMMTASVRYATGCPTALREQFCAAASLTTIRVGSMILVGQEEASGSDQPLVVLRQKKHVLRAILRVELYKSEREVDGLWLPVKHTVICMSRGQFTPVQIRLATYVKF